MAAERPAAAPWWPTAEIDCDGVLRAVGALSLARILDAETCASLVGELVTRSSSVARTFSPETMRREYTPEHASSRIVAAPPAAERTVREALSGAVPRIAACFGRPLELGAELRFLRYGPGDFISPHCDVLHDPDVPQAIREREVIFTLALNSHDAPTGRTFDGGAFVIHPDGDTELELECEPGTLIAIRSDVVHSVSEVTLGVRFVVIGWLRARE